MADVQRARGCLLGQLVGDSLGSLVEFQTPEKIQRRYPDGVRDLVDGGTWDTIAGQPTDDSEMALVLARSLVSRGSYDPDDAFTGYQFWFASDPFDCGLTIAAGLQGHPNEDSQSNGALMRISPLGIFGAGHPLTDVRHWASQDASLTHPNLICIQANSLYAMAISHAISSSCSPEQLYRAIVRWAEELAVDPLLLNAIRGAAAGPPSNFVRRQGWVLIAFRNALWQLLAAPNFEEGVVDTIMRGGDTDTNAAIAGALLGALRGIDAIPARWIDRVLNCRPELRRPGVRRPRPEVFWPVDALELADRLVKG